MKYSENVNTGDIFNVVMADEKFAKADIAELTKTMLNVSTMKMNDQQQSFRPLVNSSILLLLLNLNVMTTL